MSDNPHIRYFESRGRGRVSVDLTAREMTARFRVVSDESDPSATVSALKTYVVEDGRAAANEG